MKAVFPFDYTGIMAEPWRQAGYTCFIIDAQHPAGITIDPARPGLIKVGMWIENDEQTLAALTGIVGEGVRMVAGFPPCDDMAVSGARWFAAKLEADPLCQQKAAARAQFMQVLGEAWGCPWMAENPVSILANLWRPSDFRFDPCDYALYLPADDVHPTYPEYIPPRDRYRKKTCIWHGNGFVEPQKMPYAPFKAAFPGWQKLGGKSIRTKNIRSATGRGFAAAVFAANHKQQVTS